MSIPLNIVRGYPQGLLEAKPTELVTLLKGPTLLHVGSSKKQPLFISCLLHGNETSGFEVVKHILKIYDQHANFRPLIIFIGNVYAAEKNLRKLENSADYNRIWRGKAFKECALAEEVLAFLKKSPPFAVVDLHNNTGKNPVYGCIRENKKELLTLAGMFSHSAVLCDKPRETLCHSLSDFWPAITCECGLPGSSEGIEKATDFILKLLHSDGLLQETHEQSPPNLYQSLGRIHVPDGSTLSFHTSPMETTFTFDTDFDSWNFTDLGVGHLFGWRHSQEVLTVLSEEGTDIGHEIFEYHGRDIYLKRSVIPAMLTKNIPIIFQDCLGYLMKRAS